MQKVIEMVVEICPIFGATVGFVLYKFVPYIKTKITTKKYYNLNMLFFLTEYELLATLMAMIFLLFFSIDFTQSVGDNYVYNFNDTCFFIVTILYIFGIFSIVKNKHEKGAKRYIGNIIFGMVIYFLMLFMFWLTYKDIYEEKYNILFDWFVFWIIILQVLHNVEIEKIKNIEYKIVTREKKYKTIFEPIKKGKYYYINIVDDDNNVVEMIQLPEEKIEKIIYKVDNIEESENIEKLEDEKMYNKIEKWLNNILSQEILEDVVAFSFNLYEDVDNKWSMELVGTESFDEEDPDWACDEITDFGTRDNPIAWQKDAAWEEILEEVIGVLKDYLDSGKYAHILKDSAGIVVGFVDGDLEILYSK